jgi:uncharacterized protein YndB with AHSA1/START domain
MYARFNVRHIETIPDLAAEMDLSERQITITRTLNAPIDMIWKVWTTPGEIVNWWGPDGQTFPNRAIVVKTFKADVGLEQNGDRLVNYLARR